MADRKLSASSVRKVLACQFPPRWGPRYKPAQRATRAEAPSKSIPTQIDSGLLQRPLHAMSRGETTMFALALINPAVFEMKEQFALSVKPSEHPLVGHSKAESMSFPTTSGTVGIAERLGLLSQHPKVREQLKGSACRAQWLPAPLLRDILIFISDQFGAYCVVWDVKAGQGDHGQPGPGDWVERSSPRRLANATAIDRIFVEYMRELQIPIVRVARSDVDPMLATNLRKLLKVHQLPIDLGAEVHAELLSAYAEALQVGRPPNEVIDDFAKVGVNAAHAKRVLEQAIWHRQIRVDLYCWLSIDQPLIPEVRDPLVEFAAWFAR